MRSSTTAWRNANSPASYSRPKAGRGSISVRRRIFELVDLLHAGAGATAVRDRVVDPTASPDGLGRRRARVRHCSVARRTRPIVLAGCGDVEEQPHGGGTALDDVC